TVAQPIYEMGAEATRYLIDRVRGKAEPKAVVELDVRLIQRGSTRRGCGLTRKRAQVAVVGSLNMDVVVKAKRAPKMGETVMGEAVHFIPGGKGANQAVAAAKLGALAVMIGAVGDDPFELGRG